MSYQKILIKGNVRIIATEAKDIAQEVVDRNQSTPLSSKIISTAIVCFLPIANQDPEVKSTLTINGGGAAKQIIVEVINNKVRALIGNPFIVTEYDKKRFNDIPLILGIGDNGTLKIVSGEGEKAYGGEVPLANSDVVTDLVYYMDQSRQIYSALVANVRLETPKKLKSVSSVFFEMLPGHKEEDIQWVEKFIKDNLLKEIGLEKYISNMDAKLLETKTISWHQTCSKEKMKNIIKTIPIKEREKIIADIGKIEIQCEFCKTKYTFTS